MQETLTNSELATYQDCPKKWDFKFRQMLDPIKDSKNGPLFFGSSLHKGLEIFFNESIDKAVIYITETYDAAIKEYENDEAVVEELKEHKNMLTQMLAMYAPIADYDGKIKVVNVEKEGVVRIGNINKRPLDYRFKLDQLVRYNGSFWIREYKSAQRIDNGYIENLMLDNQVSRYIYAAEKAFGIKIDGIIYEIFLKAVPEKPQILKSGKLSKYLTANITYETYLQAIKENNLPEEEYNEQLTLLKEKGNPFFRREFVMRNADDRKQTEKDLLILSKVLRSKEIPIYKCPSRDCGWKCAFRDLCIEDNEGTRGMYKIREAYHPEYNKQGA